MIYFIGLFVFNQDCILQSYFYAERKEIAYENKK